MDELYVLAFLDEAATADGERLAGIEAPADNKGLVTVIGRQAHISILTATQNVLYPDGREMKANRQSEFAGDVPIAVEN